MIPSLYNCEKLHNFSDFFAKIYELNNNNVFDILSDMIYLNFLFFQNCNISVDFIDIIQMYLKFIKYDISHSVIFDSLYDISD